MFWSGLGTPHGDGVELIYSELMPVATNDSYVRAEYPGIKGMRYFVYKCEVGLSFQWILVLSKHSLQGGLSDQITAFPRPPIVANC